jgi:hypothetical protein
MPKHIETIRCGPWHPACSNREMKKILALVAVCCLPALAADVCNPRDFQGKYGFQLSGQTTISGDSKPTVSIGTLNFHWEADSRGSLSGYSSAHYSGFLLGNPVTGSYEAHADCTLTWSLQDDSGAFQHFVATLTPDFKRAQFHQTDPGGPQHGLLMRTPDACNAATLQPRYHFSIAGSYTPMEPDQVAHTVSATGTVEVHDGGKLKITSEGKSADGIFEMDGDCVIQMEVGLPVKDSDTPVPMKVRGPLVDDGKEILAIQIDPGATVSAHFTVQQ